MTPRRSFQSRKVYSALARAGWRNPVQWSHYADHHKGLCLEFEVPQQFLTEVRYVSKRITCPPEIDLAVMKKFLTTKFKHWSYEEEYRSFIALDPQVAENGLYFSDFSENLRLKTVIVGSRSSVTRERLNQALGELASKVVVFKSRPAFKSFRVVRNKKEALWA